MTLKPSTKSTRVSPERKLKDNKTMEDYIKQLITEVCARLPYGVKFHFYPDKDSKQKEVIATATGYDGDYQCVETKTEGFNVKNIKLYLRPMSSMTEEEKKVYDKLRMNYYKLFSTEASANLIDWLIENKFDYRGIIEKGLALDLATLEND